ncbi:MAG: hypothetical protein CM15mP120_24710 [Pseudomonadota bacterium]|nr:MAG: hypothetical protein CM15mP120_24710 [Pseudomonadota bacterium]
MHGCFGIERRGCCGGRLLHYSCCLSGAAIERIENSELDAMLVTDTIALSDQAKACSKITQLSLDRLLAESIRRVSNEESISAMFR